VILVNGPVLEAGGTGATHILPGGCRERQNLALFGWIRKKSQKKPADWLTGPLRQVYWTPVQFIGVHFGAATAVSEAPAMARIPRHEIIAEDEVGTKANRGHPHFGR
jgi:hypothetical protein